MLPRYARNLEALSVSDQAILAGRTVAVVGCGGLGGYLLEYLGRLGIGGLIAIDGDCFDETNLNRQLLCTEADIGKAKALVAAERLGRVNGSVRMTGHALRLTELNGPSLLAGADLVMDACDNIPPRRSLQLIAARLNVPLVHGAIAGWYGQVATILPGDPGFDLIYRQPEASSKSNFSDASAAFAAGLAEPGKQGEPGERGRGIENRLGNLSFGPAAVAAWQTAEAVKLFSGRGQTLHGRIMVMDFLENETEVFSLASG